MLELYTGTKSVSTEWSCTADAAFSATANTTAAKVQLVVDAFALVAGDVLEIRPYEKCRNGDTQRQLEPTWILSGAQSSLFVSPEYALKNGWDFTLKITSATPRTILWSIRDTVANVAVASVTAGVTVTTNNDKTGYGLSAAAVQSIWDALTSALTTVGSIGKLIVDNLNAAISSRMATYTQPTGFLAAIFPGTVASPTNITAATGITVATNSDKTGYSLSAGGIQAIWDALASAMTTIGSVGKKIADLIAQTGDAFARLGAPVGVSHSADTAAVKADTAAALTRLPAALTADGNMKADALRVGGTLQTAGDLAALINAVDDYVDTEVATLVTRLGVPSSSLAADLAALAARVPAALTAEGNIKADVKAVDGVVITGAGIANTDEWRPA